MFRYSDVDDYVRRSKRAAVYRNALRSLDPIPNYQELNAAASLHTHLIKQGHMQSFLNDSINPQKWPFGQVCESNAGPITLGGFSPDNLVIPIFLTLFQQRQTPKECIVCTEEKYEVNYGTLD